MNRFGPLLIAIFALSQALRDVHFAGVFQGVSPFVAIAAAFAISVAVCLLRVVMRAPEELERARAQWREFVWMNLTTAIAWCCYFFAIKLLQPSIVNTLHSAMGPLTALAITRLGARPAVTGRLEIVCYVGLAAVVSLLGALVLEGRVGLALGETSWLALALPIASGVSITASLLLTKRASERGVGVDAITALRYPLITLVAFGALAAGGPSGVSGPGELAGIAFAAALLVALPLYVLQMGIAGTGTLTGHVIRSLGPVFVFALELLDDRIAYAAPVLACVLLYCVFAIGANLARGWGR